MEVKSALNNISLINSNINGYEFYQVVRIIESLMKDEKCVGTSFRPAEDIIRFNQNPNLKNTVADISRCRIDRKEDKIEVITNFIGLLGANGIMPYFFTEHILEQLRNKNLAMLNFLNIFHNRMIAFLYRAWAINDQIVSYEKEKKSDLFSKYLYSIIGYDYKLLNSKSSLHYDFKLYFAAHFAKKEQTKESLCSIIKEYFKVDAEVEDFVHQWIDIPQNIKFELDSSQSCAIGKNTIAGDKAWNCTGKFKLILGPMNLERYNTLLPGTIGFKQLCEIMSLCSPPELQYDVEFILKAEEIPCMGEDEYPQLGYNSWLTSAKPERNQNSLCFKNLHEKGISFSSN